jgi:U4/U6 small nuclear ribonucleoprotein PRP31
MSTLADELLLDFEGSGSEAGGDEHDDGFFGEAGLSGGALANGGDTAMGEVRDEDLDQDEDANMMDGLDGNAAAPAADDDDAKAKIEKMELGGVRDVHAVAGLMKTLTPVLEVSRSLPATPTHAHLWTSVYIYFPEP